VQFRKAWNSTILVVSNQNFQTLKQNLDTSFAVQACSGFLCRPNSGNVSWYSNCYRKNIASIFYERLSDYEREWLKCINIFKYLVNNFDLLDPSFNSPFISCQHWLLPTASVLMNENMAELWLALFFVAKKRVNQKPTLSHAPEVVLAGKFSSGSFWWGDFRAHAEEHRWILEHDTLYDVNVSTCLMKQVHCMMSMCRHSWQNNFYDVNVSMMELF